MGGPASQSFRYDRLYRLTHANGIFQPQAGSSDSYTVDLTFDTVDNLLSKNQVHTLSRGQVKQDVGQSYTFAYQYTSGHPHAPTHIGKHRADRSRRSFSSPRRLRGWRRTQQHGVLLPVAPDEARAVCGVGEVGRGTGCRCSKSGRGACAVIDAPRMRVAPGVLAGKCVQRSL